MKRLQLNVEVIIKIKWKSQLRNFKFEENYNCPYGGEYQKECVWYIIRLSNQKIYLHQVYKSTLLPFPERRCSISEIESTPYYWN